MANATISTAERFVFEVEDVTRVGRSWRAVRVAVVTWDEALRMRSAIYEAASPDAWGSRPAVRVNPG